MREKQKKAKEPYYIMPMHIFNIAELNGDEKLLLTHIYSFGTKGCWQGNKTLGKIFQVGERSISRWVKKLKKSGLVFWVHPKGRYRTIWVKSHPEVKTSHVLYYMGESISKESVIKGHAAQILLGQNCHESMDKSVVPAATNQCIQVRQNCQHTNNTTNKDTIKETIERPSPLPAGGQAPAALEYRKQVNQETIDNFKRKFGIRKKEKYTPMTEAETRDEAQRQWKRLFALNK